MLQVVSLDYSPWTVFIYFTRRNGSSGSMQGNLGSSLKVTISTSLLDSFYCPTMEIRRQTEPSLQPCMRTLHLQITYCTMTKNRSARKYGGCVRASIKFASDFDDRSCLLALAMALSWAFTGGSRRHDSGEPNVATTVHQLTLQRRLVDSSTTQRQRFRA